VDDTVSESARRGIMEVRISAENVLLPSTAAMGPSDSAMAFRDVISGDSTRLLKTALRCESQYGLPSLIRIAAKVVAQDEWPAKVLGDACTAADMYADSISVWLSRVGGNRANWCPTCITAVWRTSEDGSFRRSKYTEDIVSTTSGISLQIERK
jgi:hypothetical protein